MTQINQFDAYVRRRLEAWGHEFALHRDGELLGHKSKDMLQVLIEHKGEMPPRNIGFRPLTIPPLEMQVEDIVHDIHDDARHLAVVLRTFYCGRGRVGIERRQTAEKILREHVSRRTYYSWHDLGFQRVCGALRLLAKAA